MHKSAIVVGGGVAGIQAALDLGDMGVVTHLVERGPSIGGRMALLDKTFPTNDCAMCVLSPKLVEAGNHPYITIVTNAEIQDIAGVAPYLRVRVLKRPRFVNEEKCTGCGQCVAKCPVKVPDPYNKGLSQTKAIRIPFPQAVPAVATIDASQCLYHRRGVCRRCEEACDTGAIDFEQTEETIDLNVGAVILACGTDEFDARLKGEYGYKAFPNVLTSIEYERILSASGPTGGHVVRPSDGKEPRRIAILQCVGSRDENVGNVHCSAICCMQAAKDAIVTREHLPGAQATIFYMDVRAYGKGFDSFIARAREEHGTRLICARVASVDSDPVTSDLAIRYITPDGAVLTEQFDLLVLSVGIQPSEDTIAVARRAGAKMDERGFVRVGALTPVDTTREGVFACGSISGPKDIPESVMEASGAASAAAAMLGALPAKDIRAEFPRERDVASEPARIGVFVCRCGINIASTVDVPRVVEHASTLPRVRHAQDLLFSCAQDSQTVIEDAIEKHRLNRIVVAACTPRTHEALFQKTVRGASINAHLFEFANIREHCSWVHQKEPEHATEKAKALVAGAVARVVRAEPLHSKALGIDKAALVIGGGLAGMTAALDLAEQGFGVHLVEKEDRLGGNLRHVRTTLAGDDTVAALRSLVGKVEGHERITVHLSTEIAGIAGYVGNFETTLDPTGTTVKHGVVIVAAGGEEYRPTEYLYGQDSRVVTQREFERMLHDEDDSRVASAGTVAMIQCVGSRDDDRPYCSRVCCSTAIKNVIRFKELNAHASAYVLFRDIRAYGLREKYYTSAREAGAIFVRYDEDNKPDVRHEGDRIVVTAFDPVLGRTVEISPDLLVLSAGIVASPVNKRLSQLLKVPLDANGFFLEAHVKLRPVDFATDGVFVCGLSHYPKDISETIAQARAAAGRAATVLSKDTVQAQSRTARVREDRCVGCGACVEVCAYGAITVDPDRRIALVNEALCKGCGACSATCRPGAADLMGFRDEQILETLCAMLD